MMLGLMTLDSKMSLLPYIHAEKATCPTSAQGRNHSMRWFR